MARIMLGLSEELVLRNLDVRRDWGYAKEYVEAMWLMLQRDEPEDFVIGTGYRTRSEIHGGSFRLHRPEIR